MKKLFLVLYIIIYPLLAGAQEEFVTPAKFITRVPFSQLTGGVVLLKAQFHNFPDTLNFILDTGSGGISLDSLTAEYFRLKPVPSERTIRGIAGIKKVSFLNNQQLCFPNLTIDSLNFHVNDYEILTNVYGEKIDGIIGYSVLSRYILKINYDSLFMEFWTPGSIKYPKGGFLFKPTINTLPVQPLRIKDDKTIHSRFLYDMGAGLNLMLTTDFVEDSSFLSNNKRFYIKEAEGLGGTIDMFMTVIKEVKLGPYKFRKVPIYVFNDTFNVTSYPYLGGLLGNDLLRRFNAVINYQTGDFHLTPNKHFHDFFDYSYSGLELYLVDGEIIIGDVAEGSPAELAGLKEQDVVLGINKNFSGNLQQYKMALQVAGEKVKVFIKRDGDLLQYEFKIINILK